MGGLGVKSDQGQIHNPDSFTGDGSTVAFTLSHSISSPQMIIWVEGGVPQIPTTDFTVDGVTVTRTTAPANLVPISVLYLGATAIVGTPSDSTVTLAKMAVNSVDSDQYVDGSIDAIHLSANSVDSDAYVDGSIDLAHMSSQSVDEDNLHISNSGSNGQFLSKQSGDTGGLTWAAAPLALNEAVTTDTLAQTSTSTTYADVLNTSSGTLVLGPVTPVSSSNRLYLTGYIDATNTAASATQHRFFIQPMGDIGGAGYANLYTEQFLGQYGCNSGNQDSNRWQFHFIWSPSTTSACNVKFQYKWAYASTSGSVAIKTHCNLRLLEIGPA